MQDYEGAPVGRANKRWQRTTWYAELHTFAGYPGIRRHWTVLRGRRRDKLVAGAIISCVILMNSYVREEVDQCLTSCGSVPNCQAVTHCCLSAKDRSQYVDTTHCRMWFKKSLVYALACVITIRSCISCNTSLNSKNERDARCFQKVRLPHALSWWFCWDQLRHSTHRCCCRQRGKAAV